MKRFEIFKIVLFSLVILLATAGICSADTHYVTPGQSIQAAINAASNGDQIEVAPGTYNEAINFNGKAVRLYSSGGANVTTIDGTGYYHVVQCVSDEDANTILEGFTITGGNANGTDPNDRCGGGMFNYQSSPTIIYCKFYMNYTSDGQEGAYPGETGSNGGDGAGMYNLNSNPAISYCTFEENSTGIGGTGGAGEDSEEPSGTGGTGGTGGKGGNGAGIYNCYSNPVINDCAFKENSTGIGGMGGTGGHGSVRFLEEGVGGTGGIGGNGGKGAGIYNLNSMPIINNCTFISNRTGNGNIGGIPGQGGFLMRGGNGSNGGFGGCGAGMFNQDSSVELINCAFNTNSTGNGGNGSNSTWNDGGNGGDGGHGAGMFDNNSSPIMTACTFSANKTGNGGHGGEGSSSSSPVQAGGGGNGGDGAGMVNESGSSPILTDCTFTKNITGNGNDGGSCNGDGGSGGKGGHGAGIYNSGNCKPTINRCNFEENVCGNGGNGIKGANQYVITGYGNGGGSGGDGGKGAGMFNIYNCSPTVSNSIFRNNKCGDGGYGNEGGSQFGFTFSLTYTSPKPGDGGNGGQGGAGGGMYNQSSNPGVIGCEFTGNKSGSGKNGGKAGGNYVSFNPHSARGGNGGDGGLGAGICLNGCPLADVNDCLFIDNQTGTGGLGGSGTYAGIFIKQEPGTNGTNGSGGGIGIYQSSPILKNCVFKNNSAFYGGAMNNSSGSPNVINCTFTQNLGKKNGGGIYTDSNNLKATNCILWDDEPNEIAGIEPNVAYCDAEMPSGTYPGTGNINADPIFADDAGRLSNTSNCINQGNNSEPNLPDKDFDGYPRIAGGIVDMGAFEYTNLRIRNVTNGISYGTIQAAIDDANDGDEICVLPGTYNEAIDFAGKAVRLFSTSGLQYATVNGNGAYHVIKCVSGEDANTILEGFTITGGYANGVDVNDIIGGGMFNFNSSPTVKNCIFIDNFAASGSGMTNINNSSPTLTDCTFTSNTASAGGGGMYNVSGSNPILTNCTFTSNSTSGSIDAHGGGLVNVLSSSPIVNNCTFSGNSATYFGGAIIDSVNCSPIITNCIFYGNSAQYGSGVMNNDNSNPVITNCDFVYNTATASGGGMYNFNNSNPIVTNCILWLDTPDEISNSSSSPVVTYCDVNMPSGTYPGTGNINANPGLFGNIIASQPDYPYILTSSVSPCVDAGDNNAPGLPTTDKGGQLRIADGDVNGNSMVDIGAYELQPCVKNITRNRWYQFIQHSVDDVCENDTIVVQQGTYYENVSSNIINPVTFVLTSIDPNDPNIVEQTIIDGKFATATTLRGSIVEGLTITKSYVPGNQNYGVSGSMIRNCVVTDTAGVAVGDGDIMSGCTIKDNYGGVELGTSLSSSSIIEDCTIANNGIAWTGSGSVISNGNNIIRRCFISGNDAGIYCNGNLEIEDCTISDNEDEYTHGAVYGSSQWTISGSLICNNKGTGIYNWEGPIENCTITGNAGDDQTPIWEGGGIRQATGPITNCVIQGNKALWGGGLSQCSGAISNCIITGNHGIQQGGGLNNCNGAISNCTIVGNTAWKDEYDNGGQGGGLYGCTGPISNCIIWQNYSEADDNQIYSSSVPSYSCIQNWSGGGTGNISSDPCFINPDYWGDINDTNIIVEPNEVNAVWVEGSYRISWSSPCIDAGDNAAVPIGETNDISGLPRFKDSCRPDTGSGTPPIVDMGAYEFQAGAGINGIGTANMMDFNLLASQWMNTGCGLCNGADLTCDGNVDLYDLSELLNYWLVEID
jgi:predicted outer membrane repeat protein